MKKILKIYRKGTKIMKNRRPIRQNINITLYKLPEENITLEDFMFILEADAGVWTRADKDGEKKCRAYCLEEEMLIEYEVLMENSEHPTMLRRIAEYTADYEDVEMVFEEKIKNAQAVYFDPDEAVRELPQCLDIFIPRNVNEDYVKRILKNAGNDERPWLLLEDYTSEEG